MVECSKCSRNARERLEGKLREGAPKRKVLSRILMGERPLMLARIPTKHVESM
jgi:hypothetical protein